MAVTLPLPEIETETRNVYWSRISVDVNPEADEQIEQLAKRLKVSKAEVFKKAVLLLNAVVNATDGNNKKFGITEEGQTLETEFIGIWQNVSKPT